ncbi:MAG TPA: rhodanese-like domain-containing protein [Alphaproteobacteria bacterium]|nr:rhodanese-like domain-containing protein [Alphaproteobacteria bacterium]
MRKLALMLVLALGFNGAALADEDTPATLEGTRVVSAEELRAILNQKGVKVYDLRKKASYVEGHIPGAITAARHYNEKEKTLDVSVLDRDRATTVVFYSHGVSGWKSYWAAKSAVSAGYSNVLWLRGGYAEWEDKNLPVAR